MINIFNGEFYWIHLIVFSFNILSIVLLLYFKNKFYSKQIDKQLHLIISFFLCIILTLLFLSFNFLSLIIGFMLTLIIGMLKELYDYVSKKGTFDINDFKADIIGSLIATLLMTGLILGTLI